MEDIDSWCDEHLPDLYDNGMFDSEEIAENVWEAVEQTMEETVLCFMDDDDDDKARETLHDDLIDAANAWFRGHHALVVEALPAVPEETVATLQNKPQVAQHSADWYAERRNRLTASEFWQILGGQRGALKRAKLDPAPATMDRPTRSPVAICQSDGEMVATSWGHRFEPLVRRIYEEEIAGVGTVCDTLGRFQHQTIPWLSASPDGIVLTGPLAGRLLEIKSPKTRKPGRFVPDEYYVQMQIQMEVCDLDAVDFIEAQFAQRPLKLFDSQFGKLSHDDRKALKEASWKGRLEVYGIAEKSETWTYRYSTPAEDMEDTRFEEPAPKDLSLLESSVWWLMGWYPRTVLRNRDWWTGVGWPAAELFWTEVVSGRESYEQVGESGDHIELVSCNSRWMGR
jgi:hypothetical protein